MSGPIVHGGGLSAAAARYGGDPAAWLDLSTGINPNPVTVPVVPVAAWHRLPDRGLVDAARMAAQSYYGSTGILPLPVPGTQSVIQLLPRLADPARRIAILGPTYGEYGRAFSRAGFEVDAIGELSDIGEAHGMVVVVNPNNPTGRLLPADVLESLGRRLEAEHATLVVDEAFCDCAPSESLAGRAENNPNLMIFRSFGKFFGLAGLRLGFVIASDSILAGFDEDLGPWAVSGPALSIATQLLSADMSALRASIVERKIALDAVLSGAGLPASGGTALFSLVRTADAGGLHDHLCRAHILTRIFDYAPDWMRIGLAPDAAADARLAAALAAWLRP